MKFVQFNLMKNFIKITFAVLSFILLLLKPTTSKTQEHTNIFEIKNTIGMSTEPQILSHSIELKNKNRFCVTDSKKQKVPAWYDRSEKKIFIYDVLEKDGNQYQIGATRSSYVKPRWKEKLTRHSTKINIGHKIVTRKGFEINNGSFKVALSPSSILLPSLDVQSNKNRKYKIKIFPMGLANGNIMKKEYANGGLNSKTLKDNLFLFVMGVPTHVKTLDINDFQKKIIVTCDTYTTINKGHPPKIVGETRFEILLTWKSSIIIIKNYRKYLKDFYNHNGHFMSQIEVESLPLNVVTDRNDDVVEIKSSDGTKNIFPNEIDAWQSIELQESKGHTVLSFPDFRCNSIYRPMITVLDKKLSPIISHSSFQGWLPVLQKAGDYNDSMIVICDVKNKVKNLKQWTRELNVVKPNKEDMVRYEHRLLITSSKTKSYMSSKNADKMFAQMIKRGENAICRKYKLTDAELKAMTKDKP